MTDTWYPGMVGNPYSRQTSARLYDNQLAAFADLLGCSVDELGDQWRAWASAIVDATQARRIDYSVIGRLMHAAVEIQNL